MVVIEGADVAVLAVAFCYPCTAVSRLVVVRSGVCKIWMAHILLVVDFAIAVPHMHGGILILT